MGVPSWVQPPRPACSPPSEWLSPLLATFAIGSLLDSVLGEGGLSKSLGFLKQKNAAKREDGSSDTSLLGQPDPVHEHARVEFEHPKRQDELVKT